MAKLELNERKQRLLMALVERHIRHGQPVGSKTLATGSGLAVSPATIRNLMAELEDMGLLASPHTSAGRVPTERGYRLYVDTLLASSTLRQVEFLPLSGQRVLVVLVVNRSEVQNRIIQTSRDYTEVELRQAANYINKTYAGCDLDNICEGLLSTMDADRAQMDVLMQATMDIS